MSRQQDIGPNRLRLLAWGAVLFLVFSLIVQVLVRQVLRPLDVWLGFGLDYPLIDLQHGLRILYAWFFGLWSIVAMLPATVVIYITFALGLGVAYLSPGFNLVAATYLLSGPAAFALLRLCLGPSGHPTRPEWRMILLAGFLSSLGNALALGLFRDPPLSARETLVWVVGVSTTQVLGVAVVLAALIPMLRVLLGGRMDRPH